MSEFRSVAPNQLEQFFESLAATGDVSRSAEHSNISRAYVYKLRKEDAAFAKRWDEAIGDLAARVRDALVDETITGTPILNEAGVQIGRKRNSRLLERLAVTVRELEPEKPTTAVQVNTNTSVALPAPAATLADEEKRLHEIAMQELRSLPGAAFTEVDPDEDIL